MFSVQYQRHLCLLSLCRDKTLEGELSEQWASSEKNLFCCSPPLFPWESRQRASRKRARVGGRDELGLSWNHVSGAWLSILRGLVCINISHTCPHQAGIVPTHLTDKNTESRGIQTAGPRSHSWFMSMLGSHPQVEFSHTELPHSDKNWKIFEALQFVWACLKDVSHPS